MNSCLVRALVSLSFSLIAACGGPSQGEEPGACVDADAPLQPLDVAGTASAFEVDLPEPFDGRVIAGADIITALGERDVKGSLQPVSLQVFHLDDLSSEPPDYEMWEGLYGAPVSEISYSGEQVPVFWQVEGASYQFFLPFEKSDSEKGYLTGGASTGGSVDECRDALVAVLPRVLSTLRPNLSSTFEEDYLQ